MRFVLVQSKKLRDLQRQVQTERIVIFRNIQVKARAVGRRVNIVGGRKFPTFSFKQETVVSQMIVSIANTY